MPIGSATTLATAPRMTRQDWLGECTKTENVKELLAKGVLQWPGFWIEKMTGSAEAGKANVAGRNLKNAIAVTELPDRVAATYDKAGEFGADPSLRTGWKLGVAAGGIVSSGVDSVEFMSATILPVAKETMATLKRGSSVALLAKSCDQLAEHTGAFAAAYKECPSKKEIDQMGSGDQPGALSKRATLLKDMTWAALKTAKWVAYLATAGLLIAEFWVGATLAWWALPVSLTTVTVMHATQYFFGKFNGLKAPEKTLAGAVTV